MPSGVLKPDKMQGVLWDILRTEAFTAQFIKTNNIEENARLQKKVFAMHQVSKEDFYQSFNYYKAHAGMMKMMLDSMISKAGREANPSIIMTPEMEKIK